MQLTLFRLGFFGVLGPGGGGGAESIDVIVMKLDYNRIHAMMTSWWRHNDIIFSKINVF